MHSVSLVCKTFGIFLMWFEVSMNEKEETSADMTLETSTSNDMQEPTDVKHSGPQRVPEYHQAQQTEVQAPTTDVHYIKTLTREEFGRLMTKERSRLSAETDCKWS